LTARDGGPQGCRDPRHGHLLPAHLRAAGEILLPPGPGCACYRFPSLRAGRVDAVVPPIRGSDAFPHCGVGGFVMKDSGFFRNPRGGLYSLAGGVEFSPITVEARKLKPLVVSVQCCCSIRSGDGSNQWLEMRLLGLFRICATPDNLESLLPEDPCRKRGRDVKFK